MIGPLLTRPEGEAYVHCASFWDLPMVALELRPHTKMKQSIIEKIYTMNYYFITYILPVIITNTLKAW